MYQVGFKNFRRFADFPMMELGDITMLVGSNNAGKSTVVKALLLFLDNLRAMKMNNPDAGMFSTAPEFRFDENEFHDLSIGTFGRALYNKAKKDEIELTVRMNDVLKLYTEDRGSYSKKVDFSITMTLHGTKDSEGEYSFSTADVVKVLIRDHVRDANVEIDFLASRFNLDFSSGVEAEDAKIEDRRKRLAELQTLQKKETDPRKAASRNDEIDKLVSYINAFDSRPKATRGRTKVSTQLDSFIGGTNANILVNYIEGISRYTKTPTYITDEDRKNPEKEAAFQEELSNKQALMGKMEFFSEMAEDLSFLIDSISVEYIFAHTVSQNIFYDTDNKNDYMAQTIHRFARAKVSPGTPEDQFIKEWMDKFEIGVDYTITSYGGEAYRLVVTDKTGKKLDLADKGMGSNQIMILLLALATSIRKYRNRTVKPFIVIEEPEQNLHPALQSRLDELFAHVNKKFGFRFIVETHSEYMIRKAQVLTAKEKYKDEKDVEENSPYAIYYFPVDKPRYRMKMDANGKFVNSFGNGFFDEAAKLHMEILYKG